MIRLCHSLRQRDHSRGFTIVELLIVIVIIAMLAAITIVAYSGIQNRAKATALEAATNQYRKGLIQYATLNGSYPNGNNGFCLGEVSDYPSGCYLSYATDSTIVAQLKTIMPSLPAIDSSCHIMYTSSCRRNLNFSYLPTATLNGNLYPYYIIYFMDGGQNCKMAGNIGGTWLNFSSTANSSGYFERDLTTNVTMCVVSMPDPANM